MEKFDPRRIGGETVRAQVGALCYRAVPTGAQVLLVTSRDTGRWIIPKGWPMPYRPDHAAAAREAYEEAGVEGQVTTDPLGLYSYVKLHANGQGVTCLVTVFALRVNRLRTRFPEADERRRRWFAPPDAAARAQEPELADLLRAFRPDLSPDFRPDLRPDAAPVADHLPARG